MISPQASALRRSRRITITEERGWWTKGTIDDSHFELGFETALQLQPYRHKPNVFPLPDVLLTYLGLFSPKHTLAEFLTGPGWSGVPKHEYVAHQVATILSCLQGIQPMAVFDPFTMAPSFYSLASTPLRPRGASLQVTPV